MIRYRKVQSDLPCATGAAHLLVPAAIGISDHVAGLNTRVRRAASYEKRHVHPSWEQCISTIRAVPTQKPFCDVAAVFVLNFHV